MAKKLKHKEKIWSCSCCFKQYRMKEKPTTCCPFCWQAYGQHHPKTITGRVVKILKTRAGKITSRQVAPILMVMQEEKKEIPKEQTRSGTIVSEM